ncbi:MAG: hypothetical protein AAFR61_21475 [Bacteroidota bacterium]
MERYASLHRWMIIPFVIIQAGIFRYYWPDFTTQSWEIHVHYWLVTAWYSWLILQPYLISQKKIDKHRTMGMIGLVLAGGFLFTAFSLLDIPLKIIENFDPAKVPVPVSFYYGTLVTEAILTMTVAYAIYQAVRHRKNMSEHAWWLICTAFYMIGPALGRGMIVFWRAVLPPESLSPVYPLLSTELIYIPLFLLFARKFGSFRHPATVIGLLLVVLRFLRFPIGSIEWVQQLLEMVIKY